MCIIPIIIPAYEPDERLIDLLYDLKNANISPIIIIDDGSGDSYNNIFQKAKQIIEPMGGSVLTHEVNKGKGRALKTAFSYVLDSYQDAIGVVTADSDGQHTVECITKVSKALKQRPNELILGVRDFDEEGIPWKSEFGNKLTMKVLSYVSGLKVSDTQTGLRGIPKAFLEELLNVKGERFEYEMRMLLETVDKIPIHEVKIKTIYDSVECHQTHFNPVVDSIKIYKVLGYKFLLYIFSSLSSSVLDIGLFALFCYIMKGREIGIYIALATVFARIVSATYNFAINYKKVFVSQSNIGKAALKYAGLALVQMFCSALFVTFFVKVFSFFSEVVIKMIVDTTLFFLSYFVQRKWVFK